MRLRGEAAWQVCFLLSFNSVFTLRVEENSVPEGRLGVGLEDAGLGPPERQRQLCMEAPPAGPADPVLRAWLPRGCGL